MVLAAYERIFLLGMEQQAPVGLGQFALHGDDLLRDFGPAQLRQQGADEFFFELRLAAGSQDGGMEVFV